MDVAQLTVKVVDVRESAVEEPEAGLDDFVQPELGRHEVAAEVPQLPALSERERGMLDFERQWWRYAGAKEQAISDLFGITSTRYYQQLNSLIDTPSALAYDPMLVKRLRRMRQSRQRARSARRLGNG